MPTDPNTVNHEPACPACADARAELDAWYREELGKLEEAYQQRLAELIWAHESGGHEAKDETKNIMG